MSTENPYVVSEIEIPYSPEEVREVFFDFEHFADIKSTLVRDVKRLKGATGPLTVGEVLDADFGVKMNVTITENTPTKFQWKGVTLIMAGIHTFYFLPSATTPGHTTFRHSEEPFRLSAVLFRLLPVQKMFDGFSEAFKTRVEVVKGKPSARI